MPSYTWLFNQKIDYGSLTKKMQVMQSLGVPYTNEEISSGVARAEAQATEISNNLIESGVPKEIYNKEIISLIAYLQRIGVDYGKSGVTP
jgi:cytochrome c oxidase cbb3-type subunit I/II